MPRPIINTSFKPRDKPSTEYKNPREEGCLVPFTADNTLITSDTTLYTADITCLVSWKINTTYSTPRSAAIFKFADEQQMLFADETISLLAWWQEVNILSTTWK